MSNALPKYPGKVAKNFIHRSFNLEPRQSYKSPVERYQRIRRIRKTWARYCLVFSTTSSRASSKKTLFDLQKGQDMNDRIGGQVLNYRMECYSHMSRSDFGSLILTVS
jgi:hypothetical protein